MTESFIYTKKNALSYELCNAFIDNYHGSPRFHHKRGIKDSEIKINPSSELVRIDDKGSIISISSTDIHFNLPLFEKHPQWGKLLKKMVTILNENLDIYYKKYLIPLNNKRGIENNMARHLFLAPHFNMQYYKPGEGFYDWHCERSAPKNRSRVLAWMFYLNDMTEGGGTEFYHQNYIEPPEQGKLVIFSSDFIHTHKGEISKTQDKYILTGWIELINP